MPRQPGEKENRRGLGNNYMEVLKEAMVGTATTNDSMPATTQRTNLATAE